MRIKAGSGLQVRYTFRGSQAQRSLTVQCTGEMSRAVSRTIVAEPAVCEGRDAVIGEIIALIANAILDQQASRAVRTKYTPVIIHGEGGIGKSTVAMKVLVDSSVEQLFRARRSFIRCDGITAQ